MEGWTKVNQAGTDVFERLPEGAPDTIGPHVMFDVHRACFVVFPVQPNSAREVLTEGRMRYVPAGVKTPFVRYDISVDAMKAMASDGSPVAAEASAFSAACEEAARAFEALLSAISGTDIAIKPVDHEADYINAMFGTSFRP